MKPPSSWLDAGCGTGHFSRELARLGACVTGVDGAASMIEAARAFDPHGGDIAYRVTSDLARLQDTQQRALRGGWQIGDLVQHQRAAVRGAHESGFIA